MQPSDKAFDRVKSLLGKLDRSIDDARRRRLTEGDEDPDPREVDHGKAVDQTECDRSAVAAADAIESPKAPARTDSKYGRARPIRDLSGPSQANWQRA